MEIYFKFVASHVKIEQDEKGNDKQVKSRDTFLVRSTSLYTDAEAKATSSCAEIGGTGGSGSVSIDTLTKSNIINVYPYYDGDTWFEVTMALNWEDDKGRLKTDKHVDLIKGDDIISAINNIKEVYKDSIGDYTIPQVKESKILDVFE